MNKNPQGHIFLSNLISLQEATPKQFSSSNKIYIIFCHTNKDSELNNYITFN